jgi:hypothetical protein
MTNDVPDRIGLVGDGLGAWALAHKDEADVAVHYLRATPTRERAEELVHALNQARLAFAGYVSADSAIRKIDNLLASLEQEERK